MTTARPIPRTLQIAVVNLSNSGDIVAAAAGQAILIWEMLLTNSDTTKTITFQSGARLLTGPMKLDRLQADAMRHHDASPVRDLCVPLFETAAGEAFKVSLSGAASVAGRVLYSLE